MPEGIQEGTYATRRGKSHIVGKPYQSSSSRKKLPAVEARHYGDQNDMGVDNDFSMHMDATLPSVEEVRSSYGNVFFQSHSWLAHSLWNRPKMII
jgi:hypothetical protein